MLERKACPVVPTLEHQYLASEAIDNLRLESPFKSGDLDYLLLYPLCSVQSGHSK